jgi:hypothetical protein
MWEIAHNTTIKELESEIIPAPERSEYCVTAIALRLEMNGTRNGAKIGNSFGVNFLSRPVRGAAIRASFQDKLPHLTPPVQFLGGPAGFTLFQNFPKLINMPNSISTNITIAIAFQSSPIVDQWKDDRDVGYLLKDQDSVILGSGHFREVPWKTMEREIAILDRTWTLSCIPIPKHTLAMYALWSWIVAFSLGAIVSPVLSYGIIVLFLRIEGASTVSQELQRSQCLLEKLKTQAAACVQAIPHPIVVLNAKGNIEALNQLAITLFEAIGCKGNSQTIRDVILDPLPCPDPPNEGLFVPGQRQVTVIRPDGSRFPADMLVSAISLESDTESAQVLLLHDVTEKCRTMARLENAKEDLLRANSVRKGMLILMCSELLQPANVLFSQTKKIVDEMEQKKEKPPANHINLLIGSRHVTRLLEDVQELLTGSDANANMEKIESPRHYALAAPTNPPICLNDALQHVFLENKHIFSFLKIKATLHTPDLCVPSPPWVMRIISKLLEHSCGIIGSNESLFLKVSLTPSDETCHKHFLQADLICSSVVNLPVVIRNFLEGESPFMTVDQLDLGNADLFSIDNASKGASFSSSFAWPVLNKLISSHQGQLQLRKNENVLIMTVVLTFDTTRTYCSQKHNQRLTCHEGATTSSLNHGTA